MHNINVCHLPKSVIFWDAEPVTEIKQSKQQTDLENIFYS